MAFQRGHGRKNFVAIKTESGYYAAFVAGSTVFVDTAEKARLFDNEGDATEYYKRSLRRNSSLPRRYDFARVRISDGRDQNR